MPDDSVPRCGRLDTHAPHGWSVSPARTYQCPGAPVIEGGARSKCTPCCDGEHVACDGRTWVEDAPAICGCWAASHGEEAYDDMQIRRGERD